ncbi:MAG: hypothetical protein AAGA67_12035 [Cyanobacteria bacterium P01_F01_bin.153]
MSVDYFLFRVKSDFLTLSKDEMHKLLTEQEPMPFESFGSLQELMELLGITSSYTDFFSEGWAIDFEEWVTPEGELQKATNLHYNYPCPSDNPLNNVIYSLGDGLINSISTNRAFLYDFWPLIHALSEWHLIVFDPQKGEFLLKEELKFSYEEWMSMNRRSQFWQEVTCWQ